MKTCLIYGQDGLDMDVAYNLRSFYRNSGFRVILSRKLYSADLLVITRILDYEAEFSGCDFQLIHIYDYTGYDYDRFLRTVDVSKTFIFCTSGARKTSIIKNSGFAEDHIFIALPPVDISIWCKKLKKTKYHLVYIGNRKNIDQSDIFNQRFNSIISRFHVLVRGRGWNNGVRKAGLFRVSSVYSQSEYALGLMYPFQREVTFSGRFWHAPLNGCCVLSEPGSFANRIPGVIVTDYTEDDFQKKSSRKNDRNKIQHEAIQFWESQNQILFNHTESSLKKISAHNQGRLTEFILVRIYNLLFTIYQKSGLSVIIARK